MIITIIDLNEKKYNKFVEQSELDTNKLLILKE